MKKRFVIAVAALSAVGSCAFGQLTLDYCLERAEANYPLISRYELVNRTGELSLSDINKGWLPRIGVYGQATVQNVVPSFPEALEGVLDRMGQDVKGLSRLQYKAGVDLTQTIWDGGQSKAQREVERATTAENEAALDVRMYGVRENVQKLFFGILLMDEQIEQTRQTISLLEANHGKLQAMVRNGVALQSDADMVEAQALSMAQTLAEAEGALASYRSALELYVGESIDGQKPVRPSVQMPADMTSNRPELRLYESQLRSNVARDKAVGVTTMPRIGLFAQAYYGYPGLNYFESMMNRNLSFNLVAGVKVSWTIDAFYTKRNARDKIALASAGVDADRELFLFNSDVQTRTQLASIRALEEVTKQDARIVELRTSVRRAAESQLRNGVIDTTALLTKITDENIAGLNARYHEIQLLQDIYELKHTLNR